MKLGHSAAGLFAAVGLALAVLLELGAEIRGPLVRYRPQLVGVKDPLLRDVGTTAGLCASCFRACRFRGCSLRSFNRGASLSCASG